VQWIMAYWGVFRGCLVAAGLSSEMGAVDNGLCNHCTILSPL
jgi:hypothetical protein